MWTCRIERCWLVVRWDGDDEFLYTFHIDDKWILPLAAKDDER